MEDEREEREASTRSFLESVVLSLRPFVARIISSLCHLAREKIEKKRLGKRNWATRNWATRESALARETILPA